MAEELKNEELDDSALEKVVGGFNLSEQRCPRCGKTQASVYYEHDERVVLRCPCNYQWSVDWS